MYYFVYTTLIFEKEILLAIKMQEEKLNASGAYGCAITVNFENSD